MGCQVVGREKKSEKNLGGKRRGKFGCRRWFRKIKVNLGEGGILKNKCKFEIMKLKKKC